MKNWWNVDIRSFPGIDEVLDATRPWPYRDLEYVFGEHFLEHLPLDRAIKFLTNAGNSLKIGGTIRLSTPNLEWVLFTHYDLETTKPEERVSSTLRTNHAFHGWGHQFLYSGDMLAHMLAEMNFEEFSFFSYGESEDPVLQNLERHGGFEVRGGHPSVIIVEARRGTGRISPSPGLASMLQKEYLRHVASGH